MWRYKWVILAAALIAGMVGYGLSNLQETLYRAEGTVLLNDPRSSGGIANEIGLVLDPTRYVRNQAKIIESPQVAQRAADNLGTTATIVMDSTTASPAANLDAVAVTASMSTSGDAVAMVNAVVDAYEEIITEQVQQSAGDSVATLELAKTETHLRIADLDALIVTSPDDTALEAQRTASVNQLVALDTRIEMLTTNAALYGSGVQLYVEPVLPTTPVQPRPWRNAAIALVLGAFAGGTWAWLRGQRNQVADDRNAPALVLNAPLLAAIPEFKTAAADGPVPTVSSPESEAAEAYQFALSSIGFALEGIKGTTVLVTSTSPGDGKSATAINLSVAAAQDGRKLLLIDADERVRGLTRLWGLLDERGISDFDGPESIDRSTHSLTIEEGISLDFVPAGTGIMGNTATFFRSGGFRTALHSLLEGREMVIIDSPPVMAAAETTDIAAAADGIVIVVREGTAIRDLEDAKQRLSISGTPIIGYVFNRATPKSGKNGYGYGYRYSTQT